MGEIADAALNGDMCQSCGEWLGDGDGYPVTCFGCQQEERERAAIKPLDEWTTFPCPLLECNRSKFKSEAARDQHIKAKHGKQARKFMREARGAIKEDEE